MNHHVHFVELMKILTFTTFFTAPTLWMFVISLKNDSLPPLCKTNRIASLYPVWLISFLDQTDLVTQWCKIKCYFPGNVSTMGAWRLYSDSWDDFSSVPHWKQQQQNPLKLQANSTYFLFIWWCSYLQSHSLIGKTIISLWYGYRYSKFNRLVSTN